MVGVCLPASYPIRHRLYPIGGGEGGYDMTGCDQCGDDDAQGYFPWEVKIKGALRRVLLCLWCLQHRDEEGDATP
jgi:hypothetical protein